MTIDSRDVRVPAWVFSIVVPLIVGGLSYVIGLSTINAKTSVKIEHLQEEVVRLDNGKASQEKAEGIDRTLDIVQGTVIRIEEKLDKHIAESPTR